MFPGNVCLAESLLEVHGPHSPPKRSRMHQESEKALAWLPFPMPGPGDQDLGEASGPGGGLGLGAEGRPWRDFGGGR